MRFDVANNITKLLTSDLSLAMSMSVACPSTDVDELTICLLTVFEQRGLIFELLEALVKQEIEDTGMCAFPSSSPNAY